MMNTIIFLSSIILQTIFVSSLDYVEEIVRGQDSLDELLYYEQMVADVHRASEYLKNFDEQRRGSPPRRSPESPSLLSTVGRTSTRLKRVVREQNGQCGCYCDLSFELGTCSDVTCRRPTKPHLVKGNASSHDCAPGISNGDDSTPELTAEDAFFAKDPIEEQPKPGQSSGGSTTEELFNMTSTTPSKPGQDGLINPNEGYLDHGIASLDGSDGEEVEDILGQVTIPDVSVDSPLETSSKVTLLPEDESESTDDPATGHVINPDDPAEFVSSPSTEGVTEPGGVKESTHHLTPGHVTGSVPEDVTKVTVHSSSPGHITDPGRPPTSTDHLLLEAVTKPDHVTEIVEGPSPGDVTDAADVTNNPDDTPPEDLTDSENTGDCQPNYGSSGRMPSPGDPVVPQDYNSCLPAPSEAPLSPDA